MKDYNTDFDLYSIDFSDCEIDYDLTSPYSDTFTDYDSMRTSCCFTGHRDITPSDTGKLISLLKSTALYLISLGVKEFRCGGATGFDMLAAATVYDIARENKNIKLIFDLPFEKYNAKWSDDKKKQLDFLLSFASEVNYISDNSPVDYHSAVNMYYKRNRHLVDSCYYCICYLCKSDKSGTSYTVDYANLHNRHVINLADEIKQDINS